LGKDQWDEVSEILMKKRRKRKKKVHYVVATVLLVNRNTTDTHFHDHISQRHSRLLFLSIPHFLRRWKLPRVIDQADER
jgi:hypothetical protein